MSSLKLGQSVELTDKGVKGQVAFIGLTKFAKDKWVGIILEEAKGKNNGTVEGVTYFKCPANFGIFVKYNSPTIKILKEDKTGSNSSLASSTSTTSSKLAGQTTSKLKKPSTTFGSRNSINKLTASQTSADKVEITNVTNIPKLITNTKEDDNNLQSTIDQLAYQPITTTNLKPISRPTVDVKTMATNITAAINVNRGENIELLKAEIIDLNEKIETLKKKLHEERDKSKEFEKTKIHLQQLQEFKKQITESHAELNRQLQQAKREAKEAIEEKLRHADEMKDLSDTAEIATLDKEMAEEKLEEANQKYAELLVKYEETQLDYQLLKSRIEEQGTGAVLNDHRVDELSQQNERLRTACLKLKELSDELQNELQKLKKEFDQVQNEKSQLEKFKKKSLEEIKQLEDQIIDLKEQIDFNLGSQEMVEILTDKNLKQEDKIRELEENIVQLEEIYEINEQLQETARETELELKEELGK